ncbi:LysM peptidoglycan-binding domain-containing protein [Specibacter sp. NPDC078692]|uniref:LysM peptidoglycan-binding domain-containing protein n=1 Tax=Specibacter sp. NPDC078692 TaxID=3155818 RepID=UPI003437A6EA
MTLNGIDISRYQAGIDLKTVPADFVIIGTSDGSFVNPEADKQYQAAVAAGKEVGVYHYFRNDPITEARFWAGITKGYQDGKTVFFTDAETDHPNMVALSKQFSDEFLRLTGVRPVTYTYWHLLAKYNWQSHVDANIGLWGAWYPLLNQPAGYTIPDRQSPPYWGESMMAWQYTSAGRLPGWNGDLDLNVFYGDKAAWRKYAAKNGVVTAPPSAVKPKPAPVKPAPAPTKPATSGTYTIKAGDSLSGIAARYGTTYTELARINGISNPDRINAGQVIKVTGGAAPAKPATYTVRAGDSLSSIADANGTTWQKLAQINGLANPDYIQAGQTLRLR